MTPDQPSPRSDMKPAVEAPPGLLAWFAANSVAANLLMLIIFLGGSLSLLQIDKQAYPRFAPAYVNITAAYPGAGPAEVEAGVCIPIEEAIHDLAGIKHLSTSAIDGQCEVGVQVEQDYDLKQLVSSIRARTQALRTLPKAVEKIDIDDVGWESAAITVILTGQVDKLTLRQLAEQVRHGLAALPGVQRVKLWNTVAYEIAIEAPAAKLRQQQLTLAEVTEAVRQSSLDLPGGELKAPAGEFQLRTKQTAYDRARLLNLPLRTTADGAVITLGDVAFVTDGFADQHFENSSDGLPSESMWVIPQRDLVRVAEDVKQYVAALAPNLPEGIQIITRRDNARSFTELLDTLLVECLTGFFLVMFVLMLFLRLQVAFWAAVGVGISIFGAFWWLPFAGVTLNMLSLFGFVLAMGVLVDDAIIVSERIHELQAQGVTGVHGAIRGVREVATPVALGIGIGLVAFLPGLFVPPSWATQFMKPVAVVMILTLGFSLLESLLILPAHLAHEPPLPRYLSLLDRVRAAVNAALAAFIVRIYQPLLQGVLAWRYTTVAVFVAALMVGVGLMQGGHLEVALKEDVSYSEFHVHLQPPLGTPYTETQARVKQFVDALQHVEADLHPLLPPGSPKVIEGVDVVLGEIDPQVYVEFSTEARKRIHIRDVIKLWYRHIGDVGDFSPDFHTPTEQDVTDLEVELRAQDPIVLNAAADAVKTKIASYPDIIDIIDSRKPGKPELRLFVTAEGQRLGLRTKELAEQVRRAYEGEEAQRFMRGRVEVKIRVRHPRAERQSLEALRNLPIRLPDGSQTPLGVVARIGYGPGFGALTREDRQGLVSFQVRLREHPTFSADAINEELEEHFYPELKERFSDLDISGGEADEEADEIMAGLKRNTLIALAVIYAIIAVSFRSYVQPLMFLLTVPVAWLGVVVSHWLFDLTLTFQSLVGMVAASGVVVNDSVVLLDYIQQRKTEHTPAMDLIIEACASRFRPIIIVALTNLAGFFPMLFETSEQAKFLVPVSLSLASGLIFGLIGTLILVPACYAVLADLPQRSHPS